MKSLRQGLNGMCIGVSVSLLAACGGGGSDAVTPVADAVVPVVIAPIVPLADARNGDYTAFAADGYQYVLSLNFDAKSYKMAGNAIDVSGAIATDGAGFVFLPITTGAVVNTAKFTQANNTIVGGFKFGTGVIPFVAPRSFATSIAEAAGVYNILSTVLAPPAAPNNVITSGEITAGGQLRICNDLIIYKIESCPAASVVSGTITVVGPDFTAAFATGNFNGNLRFRIAQIGSDKVYLRASASTSTARQFAVGTAATATYAPGTFAGVNTSGQLGTATVSLTAHSSTGITPAGTTSVRAGTAYPLGTNDPSNVYPTSMLRLQTANLGDYFSIRAANLAVIAASRDSTAAPGLFEIGTP